jgi:hypothetical protein
MDMNYKEIRFSAVGSGGIWHSPIYIRPLLTKIVNISKTYSRLIGRTRRVLTIELLSDQSYGQAGAED